MFVNGHYDYYYNHCDSCCFFLKKIITVKSSPLLVGGSFITQTLPLLLWLSALLLLFIIVIIILCLLIFSIVHEINHLFWATPLFYLILGNLHRAQSPLFFSQKSPPWIAPRWASFPWIASKTSWTLCRASCLEFLPGKLMGTWEPQTAT